MAEEKSKKTNPYSDDVRPGFLNDKKSEKKKKEKGGFFGFGKNKERSSDAANDLANAEENAASEEGLEQEEGIDGASEAEEEAGGLFSGEGKLSAAVKNKRAVFTFLKRGGPSFGILGFTMLAGGMMASFQSLMPTAIEEMIIEKFNSIGISSTLASDAWLNTQLNIGVRARQSTGGNTESGITYNDVTIIGDSLSVDAVKGVNGNGRNLFAEYLPGADYGDVQKDNSYYVEYDGVKYTTIDYGKSFLHDWNYNSDRLKNYSGLSVLKALRDYGGLKEYVVFLLGTNDCPESVDSASCGGGQGWLTAENIDTLMNEVGPDRKVVLMTSFVHSGRGWNYNGTNKNNDIIRDALNRYNGRIAIVDWGSFANNSDIRANEWGDGIKDFHFTPSGGEKFVQLIRTALNTLKTGNTVTGTEVAIDMDNMFAFSDYQVKQFENNGIKVLTGVVTEGSSITVLLYKKGRDYIPVAGTNYVNNSGLVDAIKLASGITNIGTPVSASVALADESFKVPYTTASKTWRGGVSGWFDNIMSSVTEIKLSINRNRWTKYVVNKGIGQVNNMFYDIAKGVAKANTTDGGIDKYVWVTDGNGNNGRYEVAHVVEYEADGAPPATVNEIGELNGGNTTERNVNNTSVQAGDTLNAIGSVLNSKAVKAASGVLNYSCAVLEAFTSIYTVVSAYQAMQFLNLISGFLEAVDKTKAGEDGSSPMNIYGDKLTTMGNTTDGENNVVAKRTAMQSAGMAWLFSDTKVDGNDASVGNVNFENIMSNTTKLFRNVSFTVQTYEKCGYIKAGLATIDLVSTVISFIPIFGQGIKAFQMTAKQVAKLTIKMLLQAAIYMIIPIAAKSLTKMLIEDAATDWFGEDLGNALVSGAGKYLGGNGTSGGQSPGSTSKVVAYLRERDAVIADEAKYQRAIRSPFDITSQYTFLGSLYYSLIPFAYSNSGLMSSLTSTSNILSSSIAKISPTASAIGEESVMASTGDCDLLANAAGALGDAFCNPYIITDTSTLNYSPVAINELVHNMSVDGDLLAVGESNFSRVVESNFDADGKIKSKSNLAKYLTFCGQRTSPYGMKDLAIAEKVTNSNTTALKIMNYVPVVNNLADIYTGLKENNNLEWTTGRACVASDDNNDWNEFKYYQRYAENMRLVENMNPGYKSEVTAFINDYQEKNPIDQSFEGTLARFSGMTKEQVEDTLALMEYYEFLDEYEPGERYAFVEPEESEPLLFDNDNKLAQMYYVLLNQISYSDVRNRTFAV